MSPKLWLRLRSVLPFFAELAVICSTVAITGNNGNVTDRIEYSLYGSLTYHAGTTDTPFLYNGRYGVMTDANGLLYMRARYYNPYLCRFINADPSGFTGGLNLYAFADGNPIGMIDPFGLGALAVNAQSWMPPSPLLEKMLSPKLTLTDILGGLFNVAGSVANIPWTMAEGLGSDIIKTAVGEDANGNSISTGQRVFAGAMLAANFVPVTRITRTVGNVGRSGPVIIGETMRRVEQVATEIPGSKILNDMPNFRAMRMNSDQVTSAMMQYNRKWILEQMRSGRQIIDIGMDGKRMTRSIFYEMEKNMLQNYQKLHPEFNSIIHP